MLKFPMSDRFCMELFWAFSKPVDFGQDWMYDTYDQDCGSFFFGTFIICI